MPTESTGFIDMPKAERTKADMDDDGALSFDFVLHKKLLAAIPSPELRAEAASFLRRQIALHATTNCDLPEVPDGLEAWMRDGALRATESYAAYLAERKAGAPRRYFSNRAHALYFLRAVAPTKLADGSWLYGLMEHWRNPRFSDLVRTYLEELGDGASDKNHVLLYRNLLIHHGLDLIEDLDGSFYTQGAIQLSLGCNANEFLPEIIGFNLGYEQLPLHLLITAYELNELGIDPYYFTLHVTVDNSDTGHAKRAVQAAVDNVPRIGDPGPFWQRLCDGYRLGNAGVGTTDVIQNFDISAEVVRIFRNKSGAGQGAHSDYCRVAGRSVNDWLSDPVNIPEFLEKLQAAGWIVRGAPAEDSKFWQLLVGDRAEMFGVFSSYELQVIHDWIRGEASSDGKTFVSSDVASEPKRQPSFRVAARLAAARGTSPLGTEAPTDTLDYDLQVLNDQLTQLDGEAQAKMLVDVMAPSQHWTLAGLRATQLFVERSR